MIKILLFALVCASFGQVHGGDFEEEMKTAIRVVDALNRIIQGFLSDTRNKADEIAHRLPLRVEAFNRKVTELKQKAVGNVQSMSKVFQKTAKDNKLPESVTECIIKEEAAAIKAIEETATKYTNEGKKIATEKSNVHEKIRKELKTAESTLEATYKKGMADVKNCKDVETLKKTLDKVEKEMSALGDKVHDLADNMMSNYFNFEQSLAVSTAGAAATINSNASNGIKKMKACLKFNQI